MLGKYLGGDKQFRGLPVAGLLTVLGAFLIELMLGAFYTFGNVMPYYVSYMRNVTGEDITYSQFNNVNLAYGISTGLGLFVGPLVLVHTIGYHGIMTLGSVCCVVGCLTTRWTLDISVELVILTYGFIQGLGSMSLMGCYMVPMRWFPENRGIVMGIVVGGYGISSTIWSQIQLALTNPNNVEAEAEDGGDAFFTDPDVLDRVPTLIYFMSALYAVVLTIGILLMSEAPKEEEEAQKIKKLSEKNYSKALSNFARNVLVRPEFYMLAGIRVGFTLVTYTVPAYYKAFGLALGYEDAFITNYVATISGLSQMTSRLIYGILLDYIPFRLLIGFQSIVLAVGVALFYTIANLGEITYTLGMHLIYLTFPGIYAILPAKCYEVFGPKYGALVLGTISLTDVALNLTIGVFSQAILGSDPQVTDYLTYFLVVTAGPILAFLSLLFFTKTQEDKKRSEKVVARLLLV